MNNPFAIVAGRLSATTRYRVGRWQGRGRQVALACLLLAGSDAVVATETCLHSGSITATLGSNTLNVLPDLPVGDWIGDWVAMFPRSSVWNCSDMPIVSSRYWGTVGSMTTGTVIAGISPDGRTVYETSVAGVGIVIEWNSDVGATSSTYTDLGMTDGYGGRASWGLIESQVNLTLRGRLIKTGTTGSGTLSLAGLQGSVAISQTINASMTSHTSLMPGTAVSINFAGNWTITSLTCETPDVMVPMGNHHKTDFSGMGSRVGARDFDIAVNNCPAGISSIQYSLSPLNGVVDAAQGVIALSAGSGSATGVGIQITERDGVTPVPVVPDQAAKRPVPGSTTAGGSFTIPLRAAYYQSASTVTGGTADAQVELVMSYE